MSDLLEWLDNARCLHVGGDVFFPEVGEDTEAAKAVCRPCESRLPCLRYSLDPGDRDGIFGGFTERVRRRIARRHAAGESLEDIIAEDDAAFYARLELSAERAAAAAERRRAKERARYAAARVRIAELGRAS